MKDRPIQQKDIARLLQVSTMTVSKALRDHPDISLEMRKKVKYLAGKLGYLPNFVARNLSSKRTYTIGIVMPRIAHSFYSLVLDGIYQAAKEKGYHIVMTVSQENEEIEKENIQTLLAMRVDGLLVSISELTESDHIFKIVKELGIPLVFFDRIYEGLGFSSVTVDDYAGALMAVEHAISLGYKEIAHLAGHLHLELCRKRYSGYEDALKKYGISIKKDWVIECGFGEQAGYQGFMELYSKKKLPEVVFTVSDSVAMGVYKAINEIGLKIPEEMRVIGFTDIETSRVITPPLTTIHEPATDIGKTAVELLINEIESDEPPEQKHILLKPELRIRKSCGEELSMA